MEQGCRVQDVGRNHLAVGGEGSGRSIVEFRPVFTSATGDQDLAVSEQGDCMMTTDHGHVPRGAKGAPYTKVAVCPDRRLSCSQSE